MDEDSMNSVTMESSSSGRGTPQVSNPGTPLVSNPGTPRSVTDEVRNTPPPNPPSAAPSPANVMASPAMPSPMMTHPSLPPSQTAVSAMAAPPPRLPQSKYAQLLAVIEDMGKDIRPTYSGSKTSAERLKRGIVHARILVRECLMECERAARS